MLLFRSPNPYYLLQRLYQLKLKELEAEEELINQKSHPEYHTKLAHLLEKKERNLKRAQDRLAFVTENFKKTLDCCIQEASETLSVSWPLYFRPTKIF